MLKPIFGGTLNPFVSSDVLMTAGTVVKLDDANAGKIVKAGAGEGDLAIGLLAQDVIAADVDNFKLDSVTAQARVGDKVGVYFDGGMYFTDQYVGVVDEGDLLYVDADGKLTTVASGNAVAQAHTAGNIANGDKLKVQLLK